MIEGIKQKSLIFMGLILLAATLLVACSQDKSSTETDIPTPTASATVTSVVPTIVEIEPEVDEPNVTPISEIDNYQIPQAIESAEANLAELGLSIEPLAEDNNATGAIEWGVIIIHSDGSEGVLGTLAINSQDQVILKVRVDESSRFLELDRLTEVETESGITELAFTDEDGNLISYSTDLGKWRVQGDGTTETICEREKCTEEDIESFLVKLSGRIGVRLLLTPLYEGGEDVGPWVLTLLDVEDLGEIHLSDNNIRLHLTGLDVEVPLRYLKPTENQSAGEHALTVETPDAIYKYNPIDEVWRLSTGEETKARVNIETDWVEPVIISDSKDILEKNYVKTYYATIEGFQVEFSFALDNTIIEDERYPVTGFRINTETYEPQALIDRMGEQIMRSHFVAWQQDYPGQDLNFEGYMQLVKQGGGAYSAPGVEESRIDSLNSLNGLGTYGPVRINPSKPITYIYSFQLNPAKVAMTSFILLVKTNGSIEYRLQAMPQPFDTATSQAALSEYFGLQIARLIGRAAIVMAHPDETLYISKGQVPLPGNQQIFDLAHEFNVVRVVDLTKVPFVGLTPE